MDRSRTEGENCLYFAMMICCCWWISVHQWHLGTDREPKEKLFLLCNDDLLLQNRCASFKTKLMDRWRNQRRKSFYFGMMICCCSWIPVPQAHLGWGWKTKVATDLVFNIQYLFVFVILKTENYHRFELKLIYFKTCLVTYETKSYLKVVLNITIWALSQNPKLNCYKYHIEHFFFQ